MGALLSCALVTRYGSGEPLNFFAAHSSGSGEPAAPRRQSLLRAQARYALLPAATPREGRFAPSANVRNTRKVVSVATVILRPQPKDPSKDPARTPDPS